MVQQMRPGDNLHLQSDGRGRSLWCLQSLVAEESREVCVPGKSGRGVPFVLRLL